MSARLEHQVVPTAHLGAEGLPILGNGGGRIATPDETAMLARASGDDYADRPTTMLPYRNRAAYDRQVEPKAQRVAVLENDRLRATVLLDLGGRLWSLRDLRDQTELLHTPGVIQFANLALRNAWFAGGVEWNLGVTGHWPLTCEPVSAAIICVDDADAGRDQVLRLWAHEQMLNLVWQVDMWLPERADELSVHVQLTNPHDHDVPVYWWSNIAAPQTSGGRIAMPASSAFHFGYTDTLQRVEVPTDAGPNFTVPASNEDAADFFFLADRPGDGWIASLDQDGHGLAQRSTSRLKSRKLFVWGTASGGRTWQRWLSDQGEYLEIQAGLANTQLEHLRLPASTTWSWTEWYGPVRVDPDVVRASWNELVTATGRALQPHEGQDQARAALLDQVAALPVVGAVDLAGDNAGWGRVATELGDLAPNPATPFESASLTPAQQAALALAAAADAQSPQNASPQNLSVQNVSPLWSEALAGTPWVERLTTLGHGATGALRGLIDLQLGYLAHAAARPAEALDHWQQSLAQSPNPWTARALAAITEDHAQAADLLAAAMALADQPSDQVPPMPPAQRQELLVEWLTRLTAAGDHEQVLGVIDALPERDRGLPRVVYFECAAAVGRSDLARGDADRAARLLARPIVLPDLREGDLSLDQLWFDHQRLIGGHEPLPAHYDFRMHVEGAPLEVAGSPLPTEQLDLDTQQEASA